MDCQKQSTITCVIIQKFFSLNTKTNQGNIERFLFSGFKTYKKDAYRLTTGKT